MSDKKIDFLNKAIRCTVTTIAPPVGSGPSKCNCFESKAPKSFRELPGIKQNENDNDCLFQAVELARFLKDKELNRKKEGKEKKNENMEEDPSLVLQYKQKSTKMMLLQYKELKTKGSKLKEKVFKDNLTKKESTGGFDICYLAEVLISNI